MDQPSRAQVRLILDEADAQLRRAVNDRVNAVWVNQAKWGRLQSGSTIKVAVTAMEEEASKFITICVDRIKPVAMDTEAFATIRESLEISLRFLAKKLDEVVLRACGYNIKASRSEGVLGATKARFNNIQTQLRRQLEIHRSTFTVPATPAAARELPSTIIAKPKGGKPLAAHWDEMWAEIAVALHLGDLQPRTQADIENAMKDWLSSNDIDAADSSVRKRAQQLWRKLKESE